MATRRLAKTLNEQRLPSMTRGPCKTQSSAARHSKSTDMNDDVFSGDLLGHIREQVPLPGVGPDLTVVKVGDAKQTLTNFIWPRLVQEFHLIVLPGMTISTCLVQPPSLPSKQKGVWT
jgi:hypothetical protein